MNENLPSSIPNNYAIQQQPSELYVAESRANHSYKSASSSSKPVSEPWSGLPQPHEKIRGIGYTEKDLGNGKSIIIAERLRSGSQKEQEEGTQDSPETEKFA